MDKFTHCVKCGAEKETSLECPSCGAIYEKAERLHQGPPRKLTPTPPQKAPLPKVLPCAACGQTVSVNAAACPHCGEPNLKPVQPEAPSTQSYQKIRLTDHVGWKVILPAFVMICLFIFVAATNYTNSSSGNIDGHKKRSVSQIEYGDSWPYTIPEGRLNCESSIVSGYQKYYVTIEYDGVVYAINGAAISSGYYAPLERIWRNNPQHPGSKVPDPGIIALGLKLCD